MTDPITMTPAKKDFEKDPELADIMLAPIWRRCGAFILDYIAIMGILYIITSGGIMVSWQIGLLVTPDWWIVLIQWVILFVAFWLYLKYTGQHFQRSFGQHWFNLAIIHGEGTLFPAEEWSRRSLAKLRYVIPVIGFFFGLYDLFRIYKSETHQTTVDWKNNSISVMVWSLPVTLRNGIR